MSKIHSPIEATAQLSTDSGVLDSIRTPRGARKGVNRVLTFSDLRELLPLLRKEEGQTMAEYGVVLAVITIGAVAAFTALSGGITGAINRVIGLLP